jgi:WD40 repeat protein
VTPPGILGGILVKRSARVAVVVGGSVLLVVVLCVLTGTLSSQTGNGAGEEETIGEMLARWRQEAAAKDVDHEFLREIRGPVTLKRLATIYNPCVGTMSSMRFSPDGKMLVCIGGSHSETAIGQLLPRGSVRFFDPATGEKLRSERRFREVRGVGFSPDGQYMVTTERYDTVTISRTDNWERHEYGFASGGLAFSPDGKWVAVGGEIIRLNDAQLVKELGDDAPRIRKVWFLPDGKRLLAEVGGPKRRFRVWDTQTWEVEENLDAGGGVISHAEFLADGKHFLTVVEEETPRFRLWNTQTWQIEDIPLGSALPDTALLETATLSPSGTLLFVKLQDGTMGVHNLQGNAVTKLRHEGEPMDVSWASFFAGERLVLVAEWLGLGIWDVQSGEPLLWVSGTQMGASVKKLAFSPDEKILAVYLSNTIVLWEVSVPAEGSVPSGEAIRQDE